MDIFLNTEFLIRIICAIVFGAIIGFEREVTNKFAGLRTHILVCLGACVFTILSIFAFPTILTNNTQYIGDPARIAAQIVTGIGFIGGGTVLRHGANIYGLTTAATLWMSASVGMACGSGYYILGGFCSILSLIILTLVRYIEIKILPNNIKNCHKIKIVVTSNEEEAKSIREILSNNLEDIYEISSSISSREDNLYKIVIKLQTKSIDPVKMIYKKIYDTIKVDTVLVSEIYE